MSCGNHQAGHQVTLSLAYHILYIFKLLRVSGPLMVYVPLMLDDRYIAY